LLDFQPGSVWWIDEFSTRTGITPMAPIMAQI
jgi:hypothetical protein